VFPTISGITGLQLAEMEDVSYQDAFLEAAGVITTGGLSVGIIDFDTDPTTKIVLGFLMIFGRLEIIAIIYIFIPKLSSQKEHYKSNRHILIAQKRIDILVC